MVDAILPVLILAAAAGLWKVGFQKIPALLVIGAIVATLSAFGVQKPEQVAALVLLPLFALFVVGFLGYVLYMKLWIWRNRDKIEEGRRRLDEMTQARRSRSES